MRKTCALALPLFALVVAPAQAQGWTPHTAAAVLDSSFSTAEACQRALDDARQRKHPSRADPVHGIDYAHLFEQGRCASFHHKGGLAWRIRMHWKRRN